MKKKDLLIIYFGLLFLLSYSQSNLQQIQSLLQNAKENIPENVALADSISQIALELSLQQKNDSLIAKSYYLLGLSNYFGSAYLKSTDYYEKAVKTDFASKDPIFASYCYNNLGINYEINADYQSATKAYLNSISIAESLGDSISKFQSYINMGFLHTMLKNDTMAENYLRQALYFFINNEDLYHQALCYQNLGILYNNRKMIDKALVQYQNAVAIYNQLNDQKGILQNKINEINTLLDIDSISGIPDLFQEATLLLNEVNDPFLHALLYNLYGRFYLKMKDYKSSESYLKLAEKSFEELGAKGKIRYIYLLYAEIYSKSNNEALFEEMMLKYDQITKEIFDEETAAKIAEYQAIYESDKKALQIERLNNKLEASSKILKLWIILAILSLGSAISILILYINNKRKQKELFERNVELKVMMDQGDFKISETNNNQYDETSLKMKKLFFEIKELMAQKKLWLDPNLKVADLSVHLYTNDKYISNAISYGSKLNFNHFVNSFRINAARKILEVDETAFLTYAQIAERTGFGNEFTFQKKFKEVTGLTPKIYRRLSREYYKNKADIHSFTEKE